MLYAKGTGLKATLPSIRHGVKIMATIVLRGRSVLTRCFQMRQCFFAAAVLASATLLANAAMAQPCLCDDREAARTWTLHRIAVIQAAAGDVTGAKTTVAQIGENEYARGPSEVTGVCFCNGQAFYDHPPMSATPASWYGCGQNTEQVFFVHDRTPDHVPSEVPAGLPANYLAADPHHGAVVNFIDKRDSYGTRITGRRYADGYAVIETPHNGEKSPPKATLP